MPLSNCPRCGQLFNKITVDICKKCQEEEDALLRDSQDYLRKNRNATKAELLIELELDPLMLDKWIKDKRINIMEPEDLAKRRCLQCGREVKGNETICRTCQLKKLSKRPSSDSAPAASEEAEEPEKKSSHGMHYKKR